LGKAPRVSVMVLFLFPFLPAPVPADPRYDMWDDHTFSVCTTPSEGPRMDILVESGCTPGAVSVNVARCESPEVGDVIK
jgi:hypothetical protein